MNELDTNQKAREEAKRRSAPKYKTNQGVETFQLLHTNISK